MTFASTSHAFLPENGWWHVDGWRGLGFSIEAQHDMVFLAAYMYDEAGNPIFYQAAGKLDSENTVTAKLNKWENGICLTCEYTPAELTEKVGTIVIKFDSPTTAEVTWPGGTINIQRFNFSLGHTINQMLGEWIFVAGPTNYAIFTGERIIFDQVEIDDSGRYYATGYRTGDTNSTAVVMESDDQQSVYILLDSSSSYYETFLLSKSSQAYNSREGQYDLHKKTENPQLDSKVVAHRWRSTMEATDQRPSTSGNATLTTEGEEATHLQAMTFQQYEPASSSNAYPEDQPDEEVVQMFRKIERIMDEHKSSLSK